MSVQGHFPVGTLYSFLSRDLDDEEVRTISTHLASCSPCQKLLRTLQLTVSDFGVLEEVYSNFQSSESFVSSVMAKIDHSEQTGVAETALNSAVFADSSSKKYGTNPRILNAQKASELRDDFRVLSLSTLRSRTDETLTERKEFEISAGADQSSDDRTQSNSPFVGSKSPGWFLPVVEVFVGMLFLCASLFAEQRVLQVREDAAMDRDLLPINGAVDTLVADLSPDSDSQ